MRYTAMLVISILLLLDMRFIYAQSDNPPDEPQSRQSSIADVATSGALTTSLNIAVPTARGPVPHLSLNYNSLAGNGIAGVGWQLTGIPAIVRTRNDLAVGFTQQASFNFLPGGWGTTLSHDDKLAPVTNAFQASITAPESGAEIRTSSNFAPAGNSARAPVIGKCAMEAGQSTTLAATI